MILVTGGAGFIGSNFLIDWLATSEEPVLNLDALTYAGNLRNLAPLRANDRHVFVHGDIGDRALVRHLLRDHRPRAIVHFAAETHVDRSIEGPGNFLRTNVDGTFALLDVAMEYWAHLERAPRASFRFLHVSTDEVYGSLASEDPPFAETSRYQPSSPYSASKAASDHLVRAWHHTYGLPALTTNCSNNYGPHQFPEKLIPLMITNALAAKPLPVYGDGTNVRDWLFVGDHCRAVRRVLENGRIGETYNIGGLSERSNNAVVESICTLLDELRPDPAGPHRRLISHVSDRPGHDWRYAMSIDKIRSELGWEPRESFDSGLRKTVLWYVEHADWTADVMSGAYRHPQRTSDASR